jgi:hypothetical protein
MALAPKPVNGCVHNAAQFSESKGRAKKSRAKPRGFKF